MTRALAVVAVALLVTETRLSADEWPAARVNVVASEDGLRFVRIIPGTNRWIEQGPNDTPPGGRNARAEFYARSTDSAYRLIASVDLHNPMSPVDARLTNDGYLVTFDNWGSIGYGNVITFYKPDGQLLRHIRLEELFSADQVRRLPFSKGSIRWRCEVATWSGPSTGTVVRVGVPHGGHFQFTPYTGEFKYYEGQPPSSCSPSVFPAR